ncbi:unnamed protein product [Triticum turgidum subsp. durum]|uniref:Uncharacterized protein n=1 Tax=Triticum turgidum subsp. durum TaxID=4567 RepID=A0A9R1C0I7_TRITD|nr:unnamed protein product [Triticum turgidum subsp. durum]
MEVMLLLLTTMVIWPKFWRYLGHKRTIRPNARRLYSLFLSRGNMSWDAFSSKVHMAQKGFMGEPKELRPGRGEFHENPSTCICENTDPKTPTKPNPRSEQGLSNGTEGRKAITEPTVANHTNEELGGSSAEEDDTSEEKEDDTSAEKEDGASEEKEEIVDPEVEDDALVRPDDPELEEVLSD